MFKESVIAQKKKLDFEKKQRLKAISLGNKFLGEWASNVLGYNQLQKRKYVSRINKVGLKYDNSRKIIRKIEKDFMMDMPECFQHLRSFVKLWTNVPKIMNV